MGKAERGRGIDSKWPPWQMLSLISYQIKKKTTSTSNHAGFLFCLLSLSLSGSGSDSDSVFTTLLLFIHFYRICVYFLCFSFAAVHCEFIFHISNYSGRLLMLI